MSSPNGCQQKPGLGKAYPGKYSREQWGNFLLEENKDLVVVYFFLPPSLWEWSIELNLEPSRAAG